MECSTRQSSSCSEDAKPQLETLPLTACPYASVGTPEAEPAYLQRWLWCRTCNKQPTVDCFTETSTCVVKMAKIECTGPLLQSLSTREALLTKLGDTVGAAAEALEGQLAEWGDQLQGEVARLAAARGRLQEARGASAAAWEQARQEAVQTAETCPSLGVAKIVADLADPAASCRVAFRRGADGDDAWVGEVPTAEPAATMFLFRMACRGGLRQQNVEDLEVQQDAEDLEDEQSVQDVEVQQNVEDLEVEQSVQDVEVQQNVEDLEVQQQQQGQQVLDEGKPFVKDVQVAAPRAAAAPRWQERANEQRLADDNVEEMAAKLRKHSRVVRGRDWDDGDEDGWPRGVATVTYRHVTEPLTGFFNVKWLRGGNEQSYWMGGQKQLYQLRLLPSPLKPHIGSARRIINLTSTSFPHKQKPKWQFLASTNFDNKVRTLRGLYCDLDPTWCLAVLERVAGDLVGLQVYSPLKQHLDVIMTMPCLEALCITGATEEALMAASRIASLRSLELHGTLEAPLPVLAFSAGPQRLRWLRCGFYPLDAALALVRAHAESLEELQLVAASVEPYGCPDLAQELRACGLRALKCMVLLRQSGMDAPCTHQPQSCAEQARQLRTMFEESGANVDVLCNVCQMDEFLTHK